MQNMVSLGAPYDQYEYGLKMITEVVAACRLECTGMDIVKQSIHILP